MADKIVQYFLNSFNGISPKAVVFWVSMLPIVELRGGILAGYALGVPLGINFLLAFVGNMIPIPFILAFIRMILRYFKKTRFRKIVIALEKRARNKSGKISKGAYWGLYAFVAIMFFPYMPHQIPICHRHLNLNLCDCRLFAKDYRNMSNLVFGIRVFLLEMHTYRFCSLIRTDICIFAI